MAGYLGRQSLVPDTPLISTGSFPFLQPFTENWEAIRNEVVAILRYRDAIPAFQEISPDQMRISRGKNWRTFVLFGFGTKLEKNCANAPITAGLLEKVPNLQTAWFSILAPGYHIPAHQGVGKGIIRAHLGLIVPREYEKCRLRVDKEVKSWRPGEIFVFDDTYEHEVWNDTDEERVILLFDFDRPMRLPGRLLHRTFLWLMKFTAFYQEPKRNLADYSDRFEKATLRADQNLEALAEAKD
jgi:beta-hydroxylase